MTACLLASTAVEEAGTVQAGSLCAGFKVSVMHHIFPKKIYNIWYKTVNSSTPKIGR
jgi:hypothetical protein